ncbi:MAG: hypothetical protein ACKV2V_11280 [Blastocatellia bacterium]
MRSSVLGDVVAEIDGSNLSVFRAYVRGGQGQALAVRSYGGDNDFYWIHADHLGSGRRLTTSTGAMVYKGHFDLYGHKVAESSPGNVRKHSRKYTGVANHFRWRT